MTTVDQSDPTPLEGLRVVEGSAFVAAPLGGMTLAQLGADVIRFDNIGGGIDFNRWPTMLNGTSLFWASMNKGKRSLAVDVRQSQGQELVAELICAPGPDNGVFLSNFPESGWLADERLRARRSDLIYVNVLGNPDGSTAVDYTINPSSGFAYATGPAGGALPTNHVLPAWDTATGLHAAIAVLTAERRRSRQAVGDLVTISLADVAFAMVSNLGYMAQAQILNEDRPPIGNDMYGAFGRDFPTADGRRVMVVAISLRQWQSLVDATEIGEHLPGIESAFGVDLSKEGDRFKARDALAALIAQWITPRSLDEMAERFDKLGVCWGPYQTFRQLVEDDWRCSPASNSMFADIDQPGIGTVRAAGTPLTFSMLERNPPSPAPRLGQHTDEILSDVLGLSGLEIGRLHDVAVVAGPGRDLIRWPVLASLTLDDIGLTERTTSELSAEHAARVGAAIDSSTQLRNGDVLPLLWHWAYFTPNTPTAELGDDGHARLPPGPLSGYPRRMWAAGKIKAGSPLVLGVPAVRTSRIMGVKESTGRSGALAIVTLEHRYAQDGADRLVEEQTLVFRKAGPPTPLPSGEHRPSVDGDQWFDHRRLNSRLLFRFSSITFNTHRIHYDQPYATSVEGYPALVVHGPLTALLVAESIRRACGPDLARFEFRANAPLFVDSELMIVGTPGTPVVAQVIRNDGVEAMRVLADLVD